jgi:hypothetical protein
VRIAFQKTIPILRIFSVEKAKEFYVDYFGFSVDCRDFYGAKCVQVIDPFGNRIRFNEDLKPGNKA